MATPGWLEKLLRMFGLRGGKGSEERGDDGEHAVDLQVAKQEKTKQVDAYYQAAQHAVKALEEARAEGAPPHKLEELQDAARRAERKYRSSLSMVRDIRDQRDLKERDADLKERIEIVGGTGAEDRELSAKELFKQQQKLAKEREEADIETEVLEEHDREQEERYAVPSESPAEEQREQTKGIEKPASSDGETAETSNGESPVKE